MYLHFYVRITLLFLYIEFVCGLVVRFETYKKEVSGSILGRIIVKNINKTFFGIDSSLDVSTINPRDGY